MSKILVVDDEASIRQLLNIFCRSEGHQVDTASDGLEAAYKIQRERYDLVVTDMTMEPIPGEEVAAFVRLTSPQTKVMALSGWSEGDAQMQAEAAGADLYMSKPFTRDEFVTALRRICLGAETIPHELNAGMPYAATADRLGRSKERF